MIYLNYVFHSSTFVKKRTFPDFCREAVICYELYRRFRSLSIILTKNVCKNFFLPRHFAQSALDTVLLR